MAISRAFKVLRDIAFTIGQGLFTAVVWRHVMQIGLAHFDVVAKHLVIAHLQGFNASALAFVYL